MNTITFTSFLNSLNPQPIPVLDKRIPHHKFVFIDLSDSNQDLQTFDINSSTQWEQYIRSYCENHQASVAYGGYLEKRNIYKRSSYFNQNNPDSERNIHLGLDLWTSAGSNIYTPLDGTVHSFANNTNYGDYGPTLILEHQMGEINFFTLYGHLSLESIKDLKVGQFFKAQECIATLGDATVNGDYAPHLHFQIVRDMSAYKGDYPGVCSLNDLEFFSNNCPDPNTLLKLG
ncbi:peptidoglycan DD-metalloendopeptidase family protein [Hanstruepera ponticola]|uniref:peptidoglycan DD-metalloendopeptidase family protein n=1 Tax=Hanstruepera ponticola TaxID=2042995 RepID=UPI001781A3B1|nr:peptidoglycan DD-metalloendopeptidase family protein [Hanstruepera ponticola]